MSVVFSTNIFVQSDDEKVCEIEKKEKESEKQSQQKG